MNYLERLKICQQPLNTFKVCVPEGSEKFDYLFPAYITAKGIVYYVDIMQALAVPFDAGTLPVPQLRFKNIPIKMVAEMYIDFTDYTLYNTKKITFHHLN